MTSPFDGYEVDRERRPSGRGLAYDLDLALSSVVVLHARAPADAYTAKTLGVERLGNGIVISPAGNGAHHRLPDHRGGLASR